MAAKLLASISNLANSSSSELGSYVGLEGISNGFAEAGLAEISSPKLVKRDFLDGLFDSLFGETFGTAALEIILNGDEEGFGELPTFAGEHRMVVGDL